MDMEKEIEKDFARYDVYPKHESEYTETVECHDGWVWPNTSWAERMKKACQIVRRQERQRILRVL
jgi:hypothetical protein